MKFNNGDKINFKPEWQDEGDENHDFRVIEVLGEERLRIVDNSSEMVIKPTSIIQQYMVAI